jgi:hypothetical protein
MYEQTVRAWIQQGRQVTPAYLDNIWDVAVRVSTLKDDTGQVRSTQLQEESKARSAMQLFDLATGPASFEGAPGGPLLSPPFARPETRLDNVPGLRVDQRVFLDSPTEGPGSDVAHELDEFAKRAAYSIGMDGVHCIAGVRGSGKSTLLNRVKWYALNWVEGERPPIVVRFDLGISFDPRKFTVDLMTETCRSASEYCLGKNVSGGFFSRSVTLLIGQIGRWCEVNWRWALILLVFGSLLFVFDRATSLPDFHRESPAATTLSSTIPSVARNHDPTRFPPPLPSLPGPREARCSFWGLRTCAFAGSPPKLLHRYRMAGIGAFNSSSFQSFRGGFSWRWRGIARLPDRSFNDSRTPRESTSPGRGSLSWINIRWTMIEVNRRLPRMSRSTRLRCSRPIQRSVPPPPRRSPIPP